MATDALTWENALITLFENISGLTTVWRDQPRPMTDGPGMCQLKVTNDDSVGIDETRTVLNAAEKDSAPPIEIEPEQVGLRTLVLQVRVETFDQGAVQRPRFFMKQIRSRLRRPSSLLVLKGIDTSLIETLPIISVDRTLDNRAFSFAVMDVRLHTIDVESDAAFGRIDKIAIQPNVTDPGGNTITVAPFTIDLPDP